MSEPDAPIPSPSPSRKSKTASLVPGWDWPVTIGQSLARDGRVTPAAKAVYLALVSYCNGDNPMPFPKIETIQGHVGMERKAVQRALKHLETWGLIVRYRIKDAGKHHSTRYELKPHSAGYHRCKKGLWKKKQKPGSQNGPSSSNQSTPGKLLIRTTPKPDSPAPLKSMRHAAKWDEMNEKTTGLTI